MRRKKKVLPQKPKKYTNVKGKLIQALTNLILPQPHLDEYVWYNYGIADSIDAIEKYYSRSSAQLTYSTNMNKKTLKRLNEFIQPNSEIFDIRSGFIQKRKITSIEIYFSKDILRFKLQCENSPDILTDSDVNLTIFAHEKTAQIKLAKLKRRELYKCRQKR